MDLCYTRRMKADRSLAAVVISLVGRASLSRIAANFVVAVSPSACSCFPKPARAPHARTHVLQVRAARGRQAVCRLRVGCASYQEACSRLACASRRRCGGPTKRTYPSSRKSVIVRKTTKRIRIQSRSTSKKARGYPPAGSFRCRQVRLHESGDETQHMTRDCRLMRRIMCNTKSRI